MSSNHKVQAAEHDAFSRALADRVTPLSTAELECAAKAAIVKHRELTKSLDRVYRAWCLAPVTSEQKSELEREYNWAVINNRAQIAVIAAMVHRLEHIPKIFDAD